MFGPKVANKYASAVTKGLDLGCDFQLCSFPYHTAIPYRVSTGPEQGFPSVLFPQQGKTCFHYRDPS